MARSTTKQLAAFLAVAVLLLQASWCALSQQQGGVAAVMAVTSFEGGGSAECDGKHHSDGDLIAALSTQWYAGGSRCLKQIRITSSQNAHHVLAVVVDECDTQSGCKDDIVATSKAVWDALGLDTNAGEVPIAWADA